MAIVSMKKAYLIAHSSIQHEVVDALHEQSLLHVSDLREQLEETEIGEALSEFKPQLKELDLYIDRVEFVLEFLKDFEEEKKGILQSMMKEKVKIDRSEFSTINDRIDFDDAYKKCENLESQLNHIRNRSAFLSSLKESLEPWALLKLKLSQIAETRFTYLVLGQVPNERFEDLQEELGETVPESYLDLIGQDTRYSYILAIYHKNADEEVQRLLYQYGFHTVTFSGLSGTPLAEIDKIEKEYAELEKEKEDIINQAKELHFLRPDIMVLLDYLENKRAKVEVRVNFAETREAFMLEGWIEADCEEDFKSKVGAISDEIELTIADPADDEKPPIVLKNKSIFQPFEVLTRLYGLPNYNEPDPTPLLAPFFFLFFGFCLGDFGYGLVLAIGCLLARRRLTEKYGISENTRRFLMLFVFGGIASMIVGVFTGSYFGIETKSLPGILKKIMLIDPLAQAELFLIITWVLGIIQIVFGILVEIYDCIRNRNISEAVFGNLSTLLFFLAAIVWLTCWLAQAIGGSLPPVLKGIYPISGYALAVTALFLIFSQGNWLEYYGEQVAEVFNGFKKNQTSKAVSQLIGIIYGTVFAFSAISWVMTLVGLKGVPISFFGLVAIVGLIFKFTRPMVTKFLGGLYGLYGMSSFLGDVLSYSRLMALGLATVLVGLVVNMGAKMLFSWPATFTFSTITKAAVGLIFAIAVLLVGHAFNLVINLLGAFVHPLRLQYVEFFPKFYEDGGKKFEPFGLKTKHLFFKE